MNQAAQKTLVRNISVPRPCCKEHSMLDVIMLALGFGFFVLAVGYAYACDRL